MGFYGTDVNSLEPTYSCGIALLPEGNQPGVKWGGQLRLEAIVRGVAIVE